ncbi:MAG: helix-turn-helix domain-containing protein [Patescibacteria group bacterium]
MLNNANLPTSLEKAGLSEKEALVYSSLIALGGAFPSQIAEHSKLNRTTVYKILVGLSIKGLVNEIKKRNKIFYQVDKPEKLLRYMKSQVALAHDRVEKVEQLLPDFEALYASLTNKPKILYFEGIDGVMSIYEDMITNQKKYEMLAFSNASEFANVFPEKFFEKFRRSKEQIGITTRGIIPDTDKDREYVPHYFAGYKKEIVPKIKFVPSKEFSFKGEITIYGNNKVSIVNLNKEYLTGLIIEDETIHNMMRMIFELSWKGADLLL